MTNDIDTLATALYVRTDDLLKQYPDLAPWRPKTGLQPRLTDAELVTLAVMQALLGYTPEARWVRYAHARLGHLFGYLPGQPIATHGRRRWCSRGLPACSATSKEPRSARCRISRHVAESHGEWRAGAGSAINVRYAETLSRTSLTDVRSQSRSGECRLTVEEAPCEGGAAGTPRAG